MTEQERQQMMAVDDVYAARQRLAEEYIGRLISQYQRRKERSGEKHWLRHGKTVRANLGRNYWAVKLSEEYKAVVGVTENRLVGPDADGEYMAYVKFGAPVYHQTVEKAFKDAGNKTLYLGACSPADVKNKT